MRLLFFFIAVCLFMIPIVGPILFGIICILIALSLNTPLRGG